MLAMPLPEKDRQILEKYICNWELLHLLDVAFRSRMKKKHADIAWDIICCGMKEEDAAVNHGVSVRTIRRTRQRGLKAAEEEIMLRRALLPELR